MAWLPFHFFISISVTLSISLLFTSANHGGHTTAFWRYSGRKPDYPVRSKRVGPLGSRWGSFTWFSQWYLLILFALFNSECILTCNCFCCLNDSNYFISERVLAFREWKRGGVLSIIQHYWVSLMSTLI